MVELKNEKIGDNIYNFKLESENNKHVDRNNMLEINVDKILPNKNQPREFFDDEKLIELAESIDKNGLIQPIIVRKKEDDKYELIAGERRLKALKLLDKNKVHAILKDVDDEESTKLALIENIQRENLNPIEEAFAYKNILEKYNMTQKELSISIGKSRPYISNTIRLLDLDKEVLNHINNKLLTVGHGKVILSIENKEEQRKIARKAISENLSVRKTEETIKKLYKNNKKKTNSNSKKDSYLLELEDELMLSLGTKVNLIPGKKKGIIEIEYYNEEDLGRLIEILK